MRRDGINQNLGLFAVGTRENPPVTISSRPEADSAFFVLSHRIVGRVADGLDAVADV